MAHFAKISENNEILTVLTLNNEDMLNADGVEDESVGQQYLEKHNNWPAHLWIQTSYNTYNNKHQLGGTPFRGNYAAIGHIWDSENNIFMMKQPHNSWVKDLTNACWKSPIDRPSLTEEQLSQNQALTHTWTYVWDESAYQADNTTGWILTDKFI